MSESTANEAVESIAEPTTEQQEQVDSAAPQSSDRTEQSDRPTTAELDTAADDAQANLQGAGGVTSDESAVAADGALDANDSGEEVKQGADDDNFDDEVQLVEADDEMPQQSLDSTDAAQEETDDSAEMMQRMSEAEKEIQRYNELVKQAGEQQLTLQTGGGEDEQEAGGVDTARSTANDTTALPSFNGTLTTIADSSVLSAPQSPHSARPPPQLSSEDAEQNDDDHSPLSPRSPSSSSPALRSWADVEAAKAECEHLLQINKTRQRQIALILDAERRQNHPSMAGSTAAQQPQSQQQSAADGGGSEPIKTDYIKLLTQLSSMWDEVNAQQAKGEAAVARLLSKLNDQDRVGEEMQDSLRAFILEMARNATDKRGNTAPLSKYERLLGDEAKVSRQLADVRLLYLQQQGAMDAVQHDIKQKEELAEGLHLIDFEQLKIENATLHEKIEERNDEIYKLSRKKHACIEVLTHVREKLWCVWRENQQLQARADDMDGAILSRRQTLKALKQQREALRRQNELLKTKEGFVGVDALVMDFEKRKELLSALRERIEAKRSKWEQLTRAKERRASAGSVRAKQNHNAGKGSDEAESKQQTLSWSQTRVATQRFSR